MVDGERFFFTRDDDGHDYIIPIRLEPEWARLINPSDDDPDFNEFNKIFGPWRLGLHSSCYTFTNPLDESGESLKGEEQ